MSPLSVHNAVMPEVPTDHRCGNRIPCDLRVLVLVHPAVFGPGVLLNVSVSGALLQTPLTLTPQTQIELEVEGPGMGRSSIMASITRREVQQYGVAFRGTNNKAIDRIVRLAHSQDGFGARNDNGHRKGWPSYARLSIAFCASS